MTGVLALLALVVLAPLAAEDAWRLECTTRRTLGIGHSVRVTADLAGTHLALRVAILLPGRFRARAFAAGPAGDAFAAARAEPGVLVALNGGYFDRDRRPLGRLVVDGVELAASARQAPLSGLAWTDGDHLHLAPADAAVGATHAVQAGPFLIDPGGGFGIRRPGGPVAARSALAVTRNGTVLAVITTPTNLHAFASVLQALPAVLDLPPLDAALNLDGGPSTGLVIQEEEAVEPRGFVVSAWGFSAL